VGTGLSGRRRPGGRFAVGALASVVVSIPFAVLAGFVLAGFGPLQAAEGQVAHTLNVQVLPRPAVARVLEVLAVVTHPNVWRALAAVIAVLLWVRGRRRLVAWLAVTMTVGGVLGPLLKLVVARARPTFDDPVTTVSGYAFPSGHALNSMLFAGCLIVLLHPVIRGARRVAVWAFAVLVVVVTAVDRIALGVHYVSDVLAGWAVALATVTATTMAFVTWRRSPGPPPPTPSQIFPSRQKGGGSSVG
jgi:membrane-associated phospholipid phosphatase